MNSLEFEALATVVALRRGRVQECERLLQTAMSVLDADVATLLSGTGAGAAYVCSWPPNRNGLIQENFASIVACVLTGRRDPGQGYVNDAAGPFSEVLTAFGTSWPEPLEPLTLVLVRLEVRERRWTSYECWAAAFLLGEHELLRNSSDLGRVQATLDLQRREADRLGRVVRGRVLRQESWGEFLSRLDISKAEDFSFACHNAPVWAAYRLREAAAGATMLSDAAGIVDAWGWARGNRNRAEAEDGCVLDLTLALGEAAREGLGNAEKLSALARSAEVALRGVGDHLPQTEISSDRGSGGGVAALVVECGWRAIRDAALSRDLSIEDLLLSTSRLLEVTCRVAARALQAALHGDKARVGREELRLYFVLLLARPGIRRRYLQADGDGARVAEQVQRTFVKSLARYALGIVAMLEHRSGIDTTPSAVSAGELLDSLLHLVDRYVHVELGVDEALEVRRLLSQGLTAEVRHHFARRHYRDHLIHVVDVFLLGHLLLDTELCWLGDRTEPLEAHLCRLVGPSGATAHWHREWAVAALLHDLGYQAISTFKESGLGDGFYSLKGGKPLDWMAPPAASGDAFNGDPLEPWLVGLLDGMRRQGEGETWLPADAADAPLDHGVLGAVRVAQLLLHAGWAGAPRNEPVSTERLRTYSHALHAIAHHNRFNHRVRLRSHPIAVLLRLCDELQEWGRRRVDVEQMVKGLYLSIQGEGTEEIPAFESLSFLSANIAFDLKSEDGVFIRPRLVGAAGPPPLLNFVLEYRDPSVASFDPVRTLLSKAYNLQHLAVARDRSGSGGLRVQVLMRFPLPREYGHIREHDIYGLFAEESGWLPVLSSYADLRRAPAGLSHVDLSDTCPFGRRA